MEVKPFSFLPYLCPMQNPKLFLCIPVMNEYDNLPSLIQSFQLQETEYRLKAIFCVNQPDGWKDDPQKRTIFDDNQKSLPYLQDSELDFVEVIDRSSPGKGWDKKNYGVGWARKTAMDFASDQASDNDIIFSMDADTFYPPDYLQATTENLFENPEAMGVAIPFYHPLPDNEQAARTMLRYEIYMRHYALNMWRINSPYKFTALGSAMALPVWAYRKVNGITPKKAGEDFYFLQKLRKSGGLLYYNPVKAFPEGRYSDRVIFGTGPAMIKGAKGDWESYPIYHPELFDRIRMIYGAFEEYYHYPEDKKVLEPLKSEFDNLNWMDKLKQNSKSKEEFVKKCHTHFDGLRILQFLKKHQQKISETPAHILRDYLLENYREATAYRPVLEQFSFTESSVADLNNIRNLLMKIETKIIKDDHDSRTYRNRENPSRSSYSRPGGR